MVSENMNTFPLREVGWVGVGVEITNLAQQLDLSAFLSGLFVYCTSKARPMHHTYITGLSLYIVHTQYRHNQRIAYTSQIEQAACFRMEQAGYVILQ